MSVTHSNQDNQRLTRIIYTDQFQIDPDQIKREDIDKFVDNIKERTNELALMKRDFINLAARYANLHQKTFFTDEDESYYIGPKSKKTNLKDTLTGNGWIFMFVSRAHPKAKIKAAINEMRTYGFRK